LHRPEFQDEEWFAVLADSRLPQYFALLIRIERVNHPRFLACDQRPLPAWQIYQNGG